MSKIKIEQSLQNLGNALKRLKEALEVEENELVIDATIQRFEFVIELFWKTLKRILEAEGIHAKTPKETLKSAYAAEWIHDETAWLQMLHDRNETSHVYDEKKAQEIYEHIRLYFPVLCEAYDFLSHKPIQVQ